MVLYSFVIHRYILLVLWMMTCFFIMVSVAYHMLIPQQWFHLDLRLL